MMEDLIREQLNTSEEGGGEKLTYDLSRRCW